MTYYVFSGTLNPTHSLYKWTYLLTYLRAQGLSKGDEHPTNTPHGLW